jgi:hypothetical protein
MKNVLPKLLKVQQEINVPKIRRAKYYKFRYVEDINQAAKGPLKNNKCTIVVDDELILIGDRYYIKATANFLDTESGESIYVNGYAREADEKTGLDAAQITGSASSYARKYALVGLLGLDDNQDPDSLNNNTNTDSNKAQPNKYISNNQAKLLHKTMINNSYQNAESMKSAIENDFDIDLGNDVATFMRKIEKSQYEEILNYYKDFN